MKSCEMQIDYFWLLLVISSYFLTFLKEELATESKKVELTGDVSS